MKQKECIPCVEYPVKEFQNLCEEIDVPADVDYFLRSVKIAYEVAPSDDSVWEIPATVIFTPVYSSSVEEERAVHGIPSNW
jgi:hypothetical protein